MLESVRAQANEEMTKSKENVNQLLQHLDSVCKERDQARDQIQKLLNKFASFNPQTGIINSPIQIQPLKPNSSITESNSLSDTYNYQSPNDPFFDIVSSPDSSNMGYKNPQQQQPPFVGDQGCLVIDQLVKGTNLPQKGKLLQAVFEAGPLLKTLLVAGQLPRWRNPPPAQGFQIPPVSIRGRDSEMAKLSVNLCQVNNNNSNVFSFSEMGCGTSQLLSSGLSMHFNGGSCFGGINNVDDYGSLAKRQRL